MDGPGLLISGGIALTLASEPGPSLSTGWWPQSEVFDLASAGVAAAGTIGATGFEPSHRHPERRARHIVQSHLVEEVHRVGVTTVLTADADLESGPGLAAFFDGDLHQAPDTFTVQRLER